jgi:hypothetical protein
MAGYCREYMKIDNDDESNKVFQKYSEYEDTSVKNHLLCKSLYADASGVCRKGGISQNKNQPCTTYADCYALDTFGESSFASCECGYNDGPQKYCGVLRGDSEWITVRNNFKEYFEATRDTCNTAARWEECGEKKLFDDWKCSELKATHYTLLRDIEELPCLVYLRHYLPIFSDVEKYCGSIWLQFQFVLLALIVIFINFY